MVAITNNPFQGLKLHPFRAVGRYHSVAITNNPFQGLKHSRIDFDKDGKFRLQ
ncbi:hypothetical protein PL11201_680114 [Planktothrix sp. PCC 11201]|nr:hypothetical protein PL11201_680114 [Planktothrix sp. PCC 11201]